MMCKQNKLTCIVIIIIRENYLTPVTFCSPLVLKYANCQIFRKMVGSLPLLFQSSLRKVNSISLRNPLAFASHTALVLALISLLLPPPSPPFSAPSPFLRPFVAPFSTATPPISSP